MNKGWEDNKGKAWRWKEKNVGVRVSRVLVGGVRGGC